MPLEPREPRGDLTFYRSPTQLGTVAKRELRDVAGRIVETTYYVERPAVPGVESRPRQLTEENLTIQQYVLLSYDAIGRLAFLNRFGPDCRPLSISQVRYDADGKSEGESTIWFSRHGARIVEAWGTSPGPVTGITCDETGRILEVTGPIPPNLDLPGGWGPELGGLSLRLIASRDRGRSSDLSLILSLRNRGDLEGGRGITADANAPVEIRDADGRVVPRASAESDSRPCDAGGGLNAREIVHVREYGIEEGWGTLPPGAYTAVARHCRPGNAEPLVSNPVMFTVEPGP